MATKWEMTREESTRKILDCALREFAENGYTKTHLSDIAMKAGVAKGLINKYFVSKDELFCALLSENVICAKLDPKADAEMPYTLDKVILILADTAKNKPDTFAFLHMLMMSTDLPDSAKDLLQELYESSPLRSSFTEAQKRGELPECDVYNCYGLFFRIAITLFSWYKENNMEVPDYTVFLKVIGYHPKKE